MRIAAIYDIHGNLPALEAVLEEIRHAGAEHIVVGGDVVPGPMPCEALACLLDFDIPLQFIHGNGDVAVLQQMACKDPAGIPEQFREVVCWTAQELHSEHERLLASWPKTLRMQIHGLGNVLFCHATPRNENEVFTRFTPEECLLTIFQGLNVSVVVCGHTHMQFDRMIGHTRVVNAGSVGMPFGEPGAYWLLLGPDVQLRHTQYDLEKAARRIRATDYPQAQAFAAASCNRHQRNKCLKYSPRQNSSKSQHRLWLLRPHNAHEIYQALFSLCRRNSELVPRRCHEASGRRSKGVARCFPFPRGPIHDQSPIRNPRSL
jgi:predicted phosphodiesterase